MSLGQVLARLFVRFILELFVVIGLGVLVLVVSFAPRTQYPSGIDSGIIIIHHYYFFQSSSSHPFVLFRPCSSFL